MTEKLSDLSGVGENSIWDGDIKLIGELHASSPLVRQTEDPRLWFHRKSRSLVTREDGVPEDIQQKHYSVREAGNTILQQCGKAAQYIVYNKTILLSF